MKKLLFLLICSLFSVTLFAQDKIYTKLQKNPIDGEVVEIGINEIKYKAPDRPNLVISIERQDVYKIVYKNGQINNLSNPMTDMYYYQGQCMNNIKVNLLNIAFGCTQIYYERGIKPGKSYEYELNLIGLGQAQRIGNRYDNNLTMQQAGIGLGIGAKFIKMPDYVNGSARLRHIMQGSYIKPAISINVYNRNFITYDSFNVQTPIQKTCFAIHPHIIFGKEWIMDNAVSIDAYFLVGYSIDNLYANYTSTANDNGFNSFVNEFQPFNGFGYIRAAKGDMGLSWGTGVKIGFLYHWKWMDRKVKRK